MFRLRSIIALLVILLALGGYYYFSSAPEPVERPEPRLYAWEFDMEVLERIEIRLPREGQSEVFIKAEDRTWHFDDPERSPVDMERWGGGIPLLLSGPGIDRAISENTTEEQLAEFGLTQPQMELLLTLENGTEVDIKVGDSTPDGINYYVLAPGTDIVALVDFSWFNVLQRLVKEPPYAPPED